MSGAARPAPATGACLVSFSAALLPAGTARTSLKEPRANGDKLSKFVGNIGVKKKKAKQQTVPAPVPTVNQIFKL